ncbi:MAG TPA: DUF2235 domain-containing protein [Pseudolabrys sp.]
MPKAEADRPKRIVLFADGTGNAFSTQESNVWRLYQALDRSEGDQIAHYIQGVGTSGFRPFALLDGATGVGVPANVRKLYEFICWNWKADDQICMFGFSRGSFTIRTLIGLIHHEGLVPRQINGETVSRDEMHRNVMAAWRSYRSKTISNSLWRVSPLIPLTRLIRNVVVGTIHTLFRHRSYRAVQAESVAQSRSIVPVKFVGLFDTVEAFGVPVEEFRRAIDWAIWPISFSNAKLSPRVENAFHALSLDDERMTFHPLRFDMRGETTERIREVWFAGVHSDVGGGYPDADLEHVPLVWMADHAADAGDIRFTLGAIDGFREAASAVGPRHDSRNGLGVFYRYGPRVIHEGKNDGGAPVIHHSVAERMVFGCDGYAPIVLPSTAKVLLPNGSTHPIHGFAQELRETLVEEDVAMSRALAAVREIRDPDRRIVSLVRDGVWWRRVAYFVLLFVVILAASLPWTAASFTDAIHHTGDSIADAGNSKTMWDSIWQFLVETAGAITAILASILALVGGFIPGYAEPWVKTVTALPITCLVVFVLVIALYRINNYLRDRIADLARQAWFPARREKKLASGSNSGDPPNTIARVMRTSAVTNFLSTAVASYVLPAIGIMVIYSTLFVGGARTLVSVSEGRGNTCKETVGAKPLVPGESVVLAEKFDTRNPCWATGRKLEKGRTYTLRLRMEEPYFDSPMMSDIAGFSDTSLRHLLGLPLRRWWSADWFQPAARIGIYGDTHWKLISSVGDTALPAGTDREGSKFDGRFFTDPDFATRLAEIRKNSEGKNDPESGGGYRIPDEDLALASQIRAKHKFQNEFVSKFVASEDGELFLYVNDVLLATPWGPITYFYANNRGTATVSILRHDNPPPP